MSMYCRDYLTVVSFGGVALALGALLLGVAALLRPQNPSPAKLIAYEGGVDPVGIGWSQSQIRYYVFALLFVTPSTSRPCSSSRGRRRSSATEGSGWPS